MVTGLIASFPLGGVPWDYLAYVDGFRRLGCDVFYLEDTGQWLYDPARETFTDDAKRIPLAGRCAPHDRHARGAVRRARSTARSTALAGRRSRAFAGPPTSSLTSPAPAGSAMSTAARNVPPTSLGPGLHAGEAPGPGTRRRHRRPVVLGDAHPPPRPLLHVRGEHGPTGLRRSRQRSLWIPRASRWCSSAGRSPSTRARADSRR